MIRLNKSLEVINFPETLKNLNNEKKGSSTKKNLNNNNNSEKCNIKQMSLSTKNQLPFKKGVSNNLGKH